MLYEVPLGGECKLDCLWISAQRTASASICILLTTAVIGGTKTYPARVVFVAFVAQVPFVQNASLGFCGAQPRAPWRMPRGVPRLSLLGQAFSRALPGAYEPPVQVAIESHYVGSFHLPRRKDEAVSCELLPDSLLSQELLRQRKLVFLFHEYRAERLQ